MGAADRCRFHRFSSAASTCPSRSFTNVCRNGDTSWASVAASTSCRSERRLKISPTRHGSASMFHISVATRLKSKYEPALRLRTTARPSTSATANSFSRTRTLSTVMLKTVGLHCAWRRQLYPMLSKRADIGMAISNENPNFVDGEDGGCGSVSAALLSSASADLVLAPIATFLMVGGSHGVRCSLLVW